MRVRPDTLGAKEGLPWRRRTKRNKPSTPYYPVNGTAEYAWNRASQALGSKARLVPRRRPKRILEAMLAVTCGVGDAIDQVLGSQGSDGSWKAQCFYAAPNAHFGSEAISTALGIEALNDYLNRCDSGNGGRSGQSERISESLDEWHPEQVDSQKA